MKKFFLTAMLIGMVGYANAQWTTKNVDNGIDLPYRICFTESNKDAYLKMENVDGNVYLYLRGLYFCGDVVNLDMSFWVNGEWKRYNFSCVVGTDHNIVWIDTDLQNETDFLVNFISCTKVRMRVNYGEDEVCTNTIYEFNMAGSTRAFNFIKQ